MHEPSLDAPPDADSLSTSEPAVGIRLPPDVPSDAVAWVILRAQRKGQAVFVAAEESTSVDPSATTNCGEAVEFAHHLGAGVVMAEPHSDPPRVDRVSRDGRGAVTGRPVDNKYLRVRCET